MKRNTLPTPSQREWITNKDVVIRFGFSPRMMERLRKTAAIHFYKIGKTIIYDRKDIDKLVTKNKII